MSGLGGVYTNSGGVSLAELVASFMAFCGITIGFLMDI